MKGKKSNYILIVVIILLWGAIYYRYNGGTEESDVDSGYTTSSVRQDKVDLQPQHFSISADYRDPFFGKLNNNHVRMNQRSDKRKSKRKEPPKEEPAVIIKWPDLDYMGLVNSNTKSVGLLKYQGKERIVMVGDSLEGICIQLLTADSIRLSYMGQFKTFF